MVMSAATATQPRRRDRRRLAVARDVGCLSLMVLLPALSAAEFVVHKFVYHAGFVSPGGAHTTSSRVIAALRISNDRGQAAGHGNTDSALPTLAPAVFPVALVGALQALYSPRVSLSTLAGPRRELLVAPHLPLSEAQPPALKRKGRKNVAFHPQPPKGDV